MERSPNFGFNLPSRDADDIADINQISDNFKIIDESVPNNDEVEHLINMKANLQLKELDITEYTVMRDLLIGTHIYKLETLNVLPEGNYELTFENGSSIITSPDEAFKEGNKYLITAHTDNDMGWVFDVVAEVIDLEDKVNTEDVDQHFDPTSPYAQSGIAVAEAVEPFTRKYELIETITLTEETDRINVNTEPNGTPYNFTNMFVMCTCPPTDKTIETYFGYHTSGSSDGGYCIISGNNTTKGRGWGACDIVGGTAFYRTCANGISDYNARTITSTIPRANKGNIKLLFLAKANASALPIGTKFEIWGVRA